MSPHVRSLVRALASTPGPDGRKRSVRGIVAAVRALGHRTSRTAVHRALRPAKSASRPSRALAPAVKLARSAVRLAGGAEAALDLLAAAVAELGAAAHP